MGASFKCDLCNRPMPPRVYQFHLKKSHSAEEREKLIEATVGDREPNLGKVPATATEVHAIQQKIEANEKEIQELTNEPKKEVVFFDTGLGMSIPQFVEKPFDWGEVYPCGSCGEEYPAKAMPFHAKVAHGV